MTDLLQPGDSILGKYRVERVLGAGGMGTVYAATDEHLRRTVAIKLLNDLFRNDDNGARLALREARAAAQLRSEHVARVLDAGLNDDATPYIVMEFLEGQDLRGRLQETIPIEDAVGFLVQACEGIAEAHAAGIVHRDLKPDNLFITHGVDGLPHVKVLDFGLAKIGRETHHSTSGNKGEYSLFGSPPYTAPERLRNIKGVDPRSDIWSLGVVLYEAVTGTRPFVGDAIPQLLLSILEETPRPLRDVRADVPQALETAVLRCLEKDPQARFQSVDQLVEALLPFASDWARAAGQRTLAMAGRGRRDSQAGIASATSSAGFRAVASTQKTDAMPRWRLRVPIVAAAAVALGIGALVMVRHEHTAAPVVLPSPALVAPPTPEPAASAAAPAVAPEQAVAEPRSNPTTTHSHAKVGRLAHGKASNERHDVDPLEGRR